MHAPLPQLFAEALHAATQVLVDRAFGDAELPGGFVVRQSVDITEDHDFVRTRRQHRQGIREQTFLFEAADDFRDVGGLIYDVLDG